MLSPRFRLRSRPSGVLGPVLGPPCIRQRPFFIAGSHLECAFHALSICFRSGHAWARVDDCPMTASKLAWSLWSHTWRPDAPGRYQILLRVDDPSIRTRRLDLFFYVSEGQIDEI